MTYELIEMMPVIEYQHGRWHLNGIPIEARALAAILEAMAGEF